MLAAAALGRINAIQYLLPEISQIDAMGNSFLCVATLYGRSAFLDAFYEAVCRDRTNYIRFLRLLWRKNAAGLAPIDMTLQRSGAGGGGANMTDKAECYKFISAL